MRRVFCILFNLQTDRQDRTALTALILMLLLIFFSAAATTTTTITNAATFVYTMFIESNRIGRLLLLFCFDEFLVEKNLSFSSLFFEYSAKIQIQSF